MSEQLLSQDDAASALVTYIFSGAIGPPNGKGVAYSLIEATDTAFVWSAALEDIDDESGTPILRYRVKIDRRTREVSTPEQIALSEAELAEAVLDATGEHLASSERFTDGALSISYKVAVRESDAQYVVQLRHHGRVASMDACMRLISRTVDPQALPVPPVYPIPGEKDRQEVTGMGRQITRLVPGVIASSAYPRLPHDERLAFVRRMARAFRACWGIRLPEPSLIGELIADDTGGRVELRVGPDRHHGLDGPFASVRAYLQAHIKASLAALEKQQGIDEYKEQFLDPIRDFVGKRLDCIPAAVEDVPVVAAHADMGPHNIIVSDETCAEIRAVIDWEFVASAPYASLHRVVEMLFRRPAPNGFGPEYERVGELREAFWGEMPEWKVWEESEATRAFLEWFRFGMFMKPEWRPKELSGEEREGYWRENIRVVGELLEKYP